MRERKVQDGPDLLTQGSADLIQSLLAADLVDVLKLLTFPVVLGSGKRLFGDGAAAHELKLVDSRVSTTGVIITTHHRDGPVRTGTFALD
ncbi:dihydrofolate reductase family protein [Inquilinus sp. CAU 1745]|uniref:dihydrofolate reductase family protein n=1 Tax=Inquilinus sp. CAU 1745 TaxID=3140369 RepID=UPI00325B35F3